MLLNAHKYILSPLIMPQQLQAIVDWTMGKYSHKLLVEDTSLYYNLAIVHVVRDFVIPLIPFDSAQDFHLHSVIPFSLV